MSKGSSPPPAPDYRGAAEQTAQGNKEALTAQTFANRPDQTSPWGVSKWRPFEDTDPATGQKVTRWEQTQNVSPELQAALAKQMALQGQKTDLASGQINRVADDFAQPFDWSNLPEAGGAPQAREISPTTGAWDPAAFAKQRDDYTQAAWQQMQPEHQRQEEALRTRLMNQGLPAGSEAFNNEMNRLQGAQGAERWNALNAGIQQQKTLNDMMLASQGQAFGQQQTSAGQGFQQEKDASSYQNLLRQQAIAEQQQRRSMSLNEINAILQGQQIGPAQMPSFVGAGQGQGPNYLAAAGQQGQFDLGKYSADQAAAGATNAGLGSLAAIAAYAAMSSDRRLKKNIKRVGTLESGIPFYTFEYTYAPGIMYIGVMADEVLPVIPEAVVRRPDGYLAVDYTRLR